MSREYSIEVCRRLKERFDSQGLYRPMRVRCYDGGDEVVYDAAGFGTDSTCRVKLVVEEFAGAGFAGQVYKVRLSGIENGCVDSLRVGGVYAMKILVPPSFGRKLFRNALYRIGFQGAFQPQLNPYANRACALWQKFIRRAAGVRFGDERRVVDIYATFIDKTIGSCGSLNEWIDGRTWRLEVDNHLDLLKKYYRGRPVDNQLLGSPEYQAKRQFMHEFVALMHEMGAHEFARQYEWSTCKSQPNCLKRTDSENGPSAGLVAVDFTAGLVLLPFLPMSPGDFKLIAGGIKRGSLVQFDRGSIKKLAGFVEKNSNNFSDMQPLLEELKQAECSYRRSVPDITHNHVRLLYSRQLWSTMLDSAVAGWEVGNIIQPQYRQKLQRSRILTLLFYFIGLIPFLGSLLRKIWGRADWRRHYQRMFASWEYLCRAVRGRVAEKVLTWYRAGRVSDSRATTIATSVWRFWGHLPLCLLPARLHRFLTDSNYARETLVYWFVRPVRLYFNVGLREQWLRETVRQGQKKHMLSDEDAGVIFAQVNEAFIQKYLKSLAVHICTLPVTQIVSVTVAAIYWLTHWGQPNAFVIGLGIIGIFQVLPVSPGSLVRGFYVVYLVARERNFRDYNIAVFLGFFKYLGYLAFPIQMTYHYPALARFMASHWATEAVHLVPVFGERGALLEHWVFCLFYNWPLTIRRRMSNRARIRASIMPRYWHAGLCAAGTAGLVCLGQFFFANNANQPAGLRDVWYLVILLPLACGALVTLGCGGAKLGRRILAAAISGVMAGALYVAASAALGASGSVEIAGIMTDFAWGAFIFAILSTFGAVIAELKLPDPELQ